MNTLTKITISIAAFILQGLSNVQAQGPTQAPVTSQAICAPAIFRTLQFINPSGKQWHVDALQKQFVLSHRPSAMMINLMDCCADASTTQRNESLGTWFASMQASIQTYLIGANGEHLGHTIDPKFNWQSRAKKKISTIDGVRYETCHFSRGIKFHTTIYPYPILELTTDTPRLKVFLFETDDNYPIIELTKIAAKIIKDQQYPEPIYRSAIVPVVEYDVTTSLEWLINMAAPAARTTSKLDFRIANAMQRSVWRLDANGMQHQHSKTATQHDVTQLIRGDFTTTYNIQQAFFYVLWIDFETTQFPTYVAIVDRSQWKTVAE